MSELKCCPWQMPGEERHDIDIYSIDPRDYGSEKFHVCCNNCFVDGPIANTRLGAIVKWNRWTRKKE